ncbi:MAG: hypothetical protein ACOYN0_05460 [Phycisphaerales bacterium]
MRNGDRFEALETRTALSIESTFGGAWTDGTHFYAAVEYTSPAGIDAASLGDDDVIIVEATVAQHPAALVAAAPLAGQNGVRAVYSIRAPGNWWDAADSGIYVTTVRAGAVVDFAGGTTAAANIATNSVWFPAVFAALVSTTVDGGSWLINVRYSGVTTEEFPPGIDDGDLSVLDPAGTALPSSLFQLQFIDGAIVATYRVDAPGSAWDAFESGRYSVALRPMEVIGRYSYLPATPFGDFGLWFGAPRATIDSITNEGSAVLAKVLFDAPNAIDPASFDDSDLLAVRSDGAELSLIRAPEHDVPGSTSYRAAYRLLGPGGQVANLQAGRYEFVVTQGAVRSVSGFATPRQTVAETYIFDASSGVHVVGFEIEPGTSSRDRWADIAIEVPTVALTSSVVAGATFARVITPHGLTMNATLRSVVAAPANGTSRVTVRMLAPDGFFNHHDNGDYAVTVVAGMLRASGSSQAVAWDAGTFTVAGQSNPRVEILARRFTDSEWLIDVRLSDDEGIDPGSFASIVPLFAATVQRSTTSQYYNVSFGYQGAPALQADGSYLVTVRGAAPSGVWSWRDSGTARIWMYGAVADTLGNRSGSGEMPTLPVQIDAPSATLAPAYYAAENRWQVTLTYESPQGFSVGAFHDGDIVSQWQGGSLGLARLVEANHLDAGRWTVVYEFRAQMAVERYPISLAANAVFDATGTPAPAQAFSPLQVNFVVPAVSVAATWATREELVVEVNFAASYGIDQTTFGVEDLTVSRGGEALTATGVIVAPEEYYNRVRVTYRFAPAGGTWDPSDNGAWSVVLQSDAVLRTNGETFSSAELQTLNLYFAAPITPRLISSTVTDTTWLVNIRFEGSDPRLNTLGNGDLRIAGRGYMTSQLSQVQYLSGAVVATYRFAAPGGAWDYEDNGPYTVELVADAVRDGANLPVAATTFAPVSLWFARPAAFFSFDALQRSDWIIGFHYGGVGGMNAASLGDDDLTVTREGLAYTVAFLSWDPVWQVARYRINPSGSAWTSADNGFYSFSVNANSVFGADGTAALGRPLILLPRFYF